MTLSQGAKQPIFAILSICPAEVSPLTIRKL